IQNNNFMDLYMPQKFSSGNPIISTKDHAPIQMNVAKVDKVTVRFNGQFKTYSIYWAIHRMGESEDPFSNWPRPKPSSQRTSDWKGSQMWNICYK
uniref:Uncharacterized protein n=1 Tax=Bos mutus grunniens TaxID=30521 RepID=A0A8B9X7T0_BOSMU